MDVGKTSAGNSGASRSPEAELYFNWGSHYRLQAGLVMQLRKEGLPFSAADRMITKFDHIVRDFIKAASQVRGYESLFNGRVGVGLGENGPRNEEREGWYRDFLINPLDPKMQTVDPGEENHSKNVAKNILLAMEIEAVRAKLEKEAADSRTKDNLASLKGKLKKRERRKDAPDSKQPSNTANGRELQYMKHLVPLRKALLKSGAYQRILGDLLSNVLSHRKVYEIAANTYVDKEIDARLQLIEKLDGLTREKALKRFGAMAGNGALKLHKNIPRTKMLPGEKSQKPAEADKGVDKGPEKDFGAE